MSRSVTHRIYSSMPPTTNTLDIQQRIRLMRSTRKVGALLGTTPYILEPENEPEYAVSAQLQDRARRRQGQVFCDSPFSSVTSFSSYDSDARATIPSPPTSHSLPKSIPVTLDLKKSTAPLSASKPKSRPAHLPTPLLLRLHAVPVPPSDARMPLSPLDTLFSPQTPTFAPPTPNTARRRRLAKLTRTLGENVPPALVKPTPPAYRRAPIPAFTLQPAPARGAATPATQTHVETHVGPMIWEGEWNRDDLEEVRRGLRALRAR